MEDPWYRKEEMCTQLKAILLQVYDNLDNLERGMSLIGY